MANRKFEIGFVSMVFFFINFFQYFACILGFFSNCGYSHGGYSIFADPSPIQLKACLTNICVMVIKAMTIIFCIQLFSDLSLLIHVFWRSSHDHIVVAATVGMWQCFYTCISEPDLAKKEITIFLHSPHDTYVFHVGFRVTFGPPFCFGLKFGVVQNVSLLKFQQQVIECVSLYVSLIASTATKFIKKCVV